MSTTQKTWIVQRIGLLLVLLFAATAYWPGLHGSFLFDDYPNITENKDLQIENLSMPALARAALSSPSSELKRPLASLSFSANFLLTGLDPFWMKLTNLLLHLLNGVLVYALVVALITTANEITTIHRKHDPHWGALFVTAGWLILPINLTAVLYVVQRMESMANLFVLLGLLGYVQSRRRMLIDGIGLFAATASLLAASIAGLMCKETAVMTPFYAMLIEWMLFRSRSATSQRDLRIIGLFFIILVVPLALGLGWQLPRILNSGAWATRNFDLPQRLMTEARVVIDYIHWTLLPIPHDLSFYHDDYSVSTSLLSPPSTLICILLLGALTILAIGLRRREPLAALGLGLFLGAQLLTATILPLELVYEHRNYFASFGLLLALIPMLVSRRDQLPLSSARFVLLGGLLIMWTISTICAAMAWGSPLSLARTLAERAPNSPRAQYGLGYTYIVLSNYDSKSPFAAAAYTPLEKAMHLPDASILPEQALIMMNARMHLQIKSEWWDSMETKLKSRKATVQDEGALEALSRCAEQKKCLLDSNRMLDAFLAALSQPRPSARLLAIYGGYAWNGMKDFTLGENMLSEAVRIAPQEPAYRITLAKMLIAKRDKKAADQEIKILKLMNTGGRLDQEIQTLVGFHK